MSVAELTVPRPPDSAGRLRWLTPARARTIGWSAFAVGTALRVIQLWLTLRIGPDSARFELDIGVPTFLAAIVLGTAASVTGAIIVARRPGNAVGWLYVATGLIQGFVSAGLLHAALVLNTVPDDLATFSASLNGVVDYAIPFSFAALVLLLFPDGTLVSPRWRWAAVLAIVGGVVRTLEVGLGEPALLLIANSTNPYRVAGPVGDALERSSRLGVGSFIVEAAFVLGAASLVVRYRAASADGRRQIRWLVVAGMIAVLSSVPLVYGTLVPGSLPPRFDALALLFAALTLAPIATLIAITRYRLYEIDRIVNRAVLYAALSAILAGVFTAGIALAQRMFVAMTRETSDVAIVITTLVVATLYAPLRKRLEGVVDQWFRYESRQFGAYRAELDAYLRLTDPVRAAQRLANETCSEMGAAGVAVIDRDGATLATAGSWPQSVSTRLPIGRGKAAAGTLLVGPRADGRPHDARQVEELAELANLVGAAIVRG
jgi:hypothetical protein